MVSMKITVIGASGLIGAKVVDLLAADGHDVVAASRRTGVDVLTGDGLADALSGADALVDVLNSPSFDDDPVMEFFTHLSDVQPFFKALVKSGRFQENMELARGHFARGIERRLSELPRAKSIPAKEIPAIAFTHAGALLSLLAWWLDRGMRESPQEMDELFHRMVWNGLSPQKGT